MRLIMSKEKFQQIGCSVANHLEEVNASSVVMLDFDLVNIGARDVTILEKDEESAEEKEGEEIKE